MTLGADPIATEVSVVSFLKNRPIPAFIVRKEPKGHGSELQTEGVLKKDARLVMVGDVVTTGGSTVKISKSWEMPGKVLALIDRGEGGRGRITQKGVPFESLYTVEAFMRRVRAQRQ